MKEDLSSTRYRTYSTKQTFLLLTHSLARPIDGSSYNQFSAVQVLDHKN